MEQKGLDAPVAFLVFNRPERTERVFAAIADARPRTLLIVADGPRSDVPGEADACRRVRDVVSRVDWDCQVLENYSEVNLGCRERVSSGLDWVFDTVEEAIVLEDDCLPHASFFRFCEELLEKYRADERIAQIGGANFQFGRASTSDSFYFSRYSHVWGWASWRRAWRGYDVEMRDWPDVRDGGRLWDILGEARLVKYWSRVFQDTYDGRVDTWDYQWTFSCWVNNRLSVLPNKNLVSNIGFGEGASHTREVTMFANIPAEELNFPLVAPRLVIRNGRADSFTTETMFTPGLRTRARRLLSRHG